MSLAQTYFSIPITSGATSTSGTDLGRGWENVYLVIPSTTTNSAGYIQACATAGGTYRRVRHPLINSATVASNDFIFPSSCHNCIIPIPNGLRFIKVERTDTAANGATYQVICGD